MLTWIAHASWPTLLLLCLAVTVPLVHLVRLVIVLLETLLGMLAGAVLAALFGWWDRR